MIVDDRHAIIGSANINERSMLGSRDSEVATIVTDIRMIPSFMAGRPYAVGEFPHTLRKRLMREHLGVDVDAIYRREQGAAEREEQDAEMSRIYETNKFEPSQEYFETPPATPPASEPYQTTAGPSTSELPRSSSKVQSEWTEQDQLEEIARENRLDYARDLDVAGYGIDNMKLVVDHGEDAYRDSYIDQRGHEVLLRQDAPEVERIKILEKKAATDNEVATRKVELPVQPPWPTGRQDTYHLGLPMRSQLPELPPLDDTDIGGPTLTRGMSQASKRIINPLTTSLRRPDVHEDCMTDPIADGFYRDIWHKVAENNTKLFRQVFHCQPDSEVLDWRSYHKFNDYYDRFMQAQGLGASPHVVDKDAPGQSGPPGFGPTSVLEEALKSGQKLADKTSKLRPGSKNSDSKNSEAATTNGEELNEKQILNQVAPGSPETRASSVRTAAPSPYQGPVDATENEKQNETANEKAALRADAVPSRARTVRYTDTGLGNNDLQPSTTGNSSSLHASASQKSRRRANTKNSAKGVPEEVLGRDEAEDLLKLTQGSLVLWPYDW
jgi:phospholipase D1/2